MPRSINIDWWLFIYSPMMLFACAIFLGFRRWTVKNKFFNILPVMCFFLLLNLNKFADIFAGDSFFVFSAMYFSCCWILIVNLDNPGASFFSFGGILNSAAALINGGKMPVFNDTQVSALHQPMDAMTKFWWLCDWIETPNGIYMMSPGDFLLMIGAVIFFMSELRLYLQNRKLAI